MSTIDEFEEDWLLIGMSSDEQLGSEFMLFFFDILILEGFLVLQKWKNDWIVAFHVIKFWAGRHRSFLVFRLFNSYSKQLTPHCCDYSVWMICCWHSNKVCIHQCFLWVHHLSFGYIDGVFKGYQHGGVRSVVHNGISCLGTICKL